MTVNKITDAPTQNELVDKVNEVIDGKQDTLTSGTNIKTINNESLLGSGNITIQTGGTVDQTYDGTSSNAQSGVAIAGANFVQNTATGTNSLSLAGGATASNYATNIGVNSSCYSTTSSQSVAVGTNALAQGSSVVAVGRAAKGQAQGAIAIGQGTTSSAKNAIVIGNGATVSGQNAIQLGTGTNSTANTFNVSYGSSNTYQMLDSSGKIPDDRLNTTIARTSQIPTVPTNVSAFTNDAGYTTNVGTVTSVNNVQPVNGNVTLSIPAAQVQSNWNETNTSSKAYIQNKPTIPSVGNGTITITQGGTTKGTFTTNQSGNATIDLDASGGSSRNIGEIVQSTIPLSDAGLHLLDGALISGSGAYADFVDYIADLYNDADTLYAYGGSSKVVYTSTQTLSVGMDLLDENGNKIGTLADYSASAQYKISDDGTYIIWRHTNGGLVVSSNLTYNQSYDIQIRPKMFMGDYTRYNYSKVGVNLNNLKEDNGVLSGFDTTTAYVTIPTATSATSGMELVVKVYLPTLTTTASFVESSATKTGIILRCVNASTGQINAWIGNGSSWFISNFNTGCTISASQWTYIKVIWTGESYYFLQSTDGNYWVEQGRQSSLNSPYFPSEIICLGGTDWESASIQDGLIDLNGCYLNINGSRYWTGYTTYNGEDAWQKMVEDYGECGKFVYDSTNNTVRLPKITGFVESASDVSSIGDLVKAGLPNITGDATNIAARQDNKYIVGSGCFVDTVYMGTWKKAGTETTGRFSTLVFDASDSNPIYGNSTTVQPQAIKVLYYIVISTTTKTEIEVDIDEVMTDLNGKADVDLTNLTATSSRNFDGQWVYSQLSLATAIPTTITNYSLASYLPNDDYIYEVIIGGTCYFNGAMYVSVGSDIFPISTPGDTNFVSVAHTHANSRRSDWRVIIPVGTGRYISAVTVGDTNAILGAIAYRRIGTNS